MPTTLLAVDDSVTMRKVLEMTFAGEDFRVVTADSFDTALAKLRSERPAIVLCDVTLEGPGGYGLCARIKAENPSVSVLILASKQQPYDNQKGQSARADDFIEKPFDTQLLIDKVKRLTTRPASAEPVAPRAGIGSSAPSTQPGIPGPAFGSSVRTAPLGAVARPVVPGAGLPLNRPAAPGMGTASAPVGRGTLAYGAYSNASGPSLAQPPSSAGPGVAARTPLSPTFPPGRSPAAAQSPSPPAVASTAPPAVASAAAADGAVALAATTQVQLAAKLAQLGLSDAQFSAVLALSRDLVEKVVWEVVPVLAETMIREEIKRLTSA